MPYVPDLCACQYFVAEIRCKNRKAEKPLKTATKKRGRPPRYKGERLSKTRSFRVRGTLDDWLRHTAEQTGRSISEEIEVRLDRSYYVDGVLLAVSGKNSELLFALSTAVAIATTGTIEVPQKFLALQVATAYIITAISGVERTLEWSATSNYGLHGFAIAETALKMGPPAPLERLRIMAETLSGESLEHFYKRIGKMMKAEAEKQ